MSDTPAHNLPDWNGTPVIGQRTKITGAGQRILGAHDRGARTVIVAEVALKSAGHTDTTEGPLYVETWAVSDALEVDGDRGRELIAALRAGYQIDQDGGQQLTIGDIGHADANGVVMTDAEVAEKRGNPAAIITGPAPKVERVVVVYDDADRRLWPDDYEAGEQRPIPGIDDVIEILDERTGETIESIRPEDVEIASDVIAGNVVPLRTGDDIPDPFDDDGDGWSDGIESFGAAAGDLAAEPVDPTVDEPISDEAPTKADHDLVGDLTVSKLRKKLAEISDPKHLARLLAAERSRGNRARSSAIDAIYARLAATQSGPQLDEDATG